jgi:hypothetical protein
MHVYAILVQTSLMYTVTMYVNTYVWRCMYRKRTLIYMADVHPTTITHTCTYAACINQDSANPAAQLNGSMGRIIGSCDMMVTPVIDKQWQNWSVDACSGEIKEIKDPFTDYKAPGFIEYLSRGWCRLEMFFNANMPVISQRRKYFGGKLGQFMDEKKRRPHLVFGTREQERGEAPLILRVLRDDEFKHYYPAHGLLFDKRDTSAIEAYVEELCKINTNLRVCTACIRIHVYIRLCPWSSIRRTYMNSDKCGP